MNKDIPFQILYFISFLWFAAVSKNFLFYLYLWETNEFKISCPSQQFSKKKARLLLLNRFVITKIFLILIFPIAPLLTFFGAIVIYLFGFPIILFNFIKGKIKKPTPTKKTVLICFAAVLLGFIYLLFIYNNLRFFEGFNIFQTPDYIVIFVFWLLFADAFFSLFIYLAAIFSKSAKICDENNINKDIDINESNNSK